MKDMKIWGGIFTLLGIIATIGYIVKGNWYGLLFSFILLGMGMAMFPGSEEKEEE